MQISRIITGVFETNTYILNEGSDYLLIDPSGKALKIQEKINGNLLGILLTHGHFDHIKACDDLYNIYKCPIYIHPEDLDLIDPIESKRTNTYGPYSAHISSPTINLKEGEMHIGPFSFTVYHTPGHTKGSCIFKFENNLFCGDTLFKGSIGRCDLYGGNERMLKDSLRLFKDFELETNVFPGHGDFSNIESELKYNFYLKNI